MQTPYVSAGNHTIDLQAATSSGYVLYATRATLTTYAGSPIASGYALSWAVGGTVYQSSSAGPMISVQAGVFVDGSSAVNVQLFRTQ